MYSPPVCPLAFFFSATGKAFTGGAGAGAVAGMGANVFI